MSSVQQFCDQCGAANRSQARFCISCGASLSTTSVGTISNSVAPVTFTSGLDAGTLLGKRYQIKRVLGQGGMGAVYLAEDMRFGGAYRAVKELSQSGLNALELRESQVAFEQEAMMLAKLLHPNLPRIYDHFLEGTRWYLVMDYIEGETLESRLSKLSKGRYFGIDKSLRVVMQLCGVLSYLHSQNPSIIFRDLKPDNVMLSADDHVYLIDFGIARIFKQGQAIDTIVLGTPGYAAPEQYGKEQTTAAADIFSLGATLHRLLSNHDPGASPFRFPALHLGHLRGGSELETLVMQMVNLDKDLRPANVQVIKQEFQRVVDLRMGKISSANGSISKGAFSPRPHRGPVTIVDRNGKGDYTTITAALHNAGANERILVRPGTYYEGLLLDKSVEIIGDGPKDQIILETNDADCILMQTNFATVRGLTLRCCAGRYNKNYYGVDIAQGQLVLEDCNITSDSNACLAIHNFAANPTIRRCRVFDSNSGGIFIYKQGRGVIEDCEIFANRFAGITIKEESDPIIRNCRIYDGKGSGVHVYEQGKGTLEGCEIFANELAGIAIKEEGNPIVTNCTIHDGKQNGVFVYERGKGTLEGCEIFANELAGIALKGEGNPIVRNCSIHDGKANGVFVYEQGKGTLEGCEIFANSSAGIALKGEGNPIVTNCTIHDGKQNGVFVYERGKGTLEGCKIFANGLSGIEIREEGNPLIENCVIKENQWHAVYAHINAMGIVRQCDLRGNGHEATNIADDSSTQFIDNQQ